MTAMADNTLARLENPVVHTTTGVPSLNFMTWAQFCAATVYTRFQILYILHKGFTMTSNSRTVQFVVPTLLAFLQVKNNGMDKSPFMSHTATMYVAITSFLIYAFLAYGMNQRPQNLHGNPPPYTLHCLVFFGNTAVASLASIFFPASISPVLYVLCVGLSAGELLYWVYQREEHIFKKHIRRFFNTLRRWLFPMEQTDILPRFVINNLR